MAHAFLGVPGIRVLVLFPRTEVSGRQRKQMTTLGDNVATISVEGKFDDCRALVKMAFADPDLAGLNLSSANSINIGRLLPQSVYYVYSAAQLVDIAGGEEGADPREPPAAVPTLRRSDADHRVHPGAGGDRQDPAAHRGGCRTA